MNKTLPRSGGPDVTITAVLIIILIIKAISFADTVDPRRLRPRYFTISAEGDLLIIGSGWLQLRSTTG